MSTIFREVTQLRREQKNKPRFLLSNGKCGGRHKDLPKPEQDWYIDKKLGDKPMATPNSPKLDFRLFDKMVRDQGNLGSCGGFSRRSAVLYLMRSKYPELLGKGEWGKNFDISPLAIYWLCRLVGGTVNEDSGIWIREAADAMRQYGAPREDLWPYLIEKFRTQPSAKALESGKWHQAPADYLCDAKPGEPTTVTVDNIKRALAAGMPVQFGFTCFDNLGQADSNGVIPLPTRTSQAEGGHAMTIFEDDEASRTFSGPNSWGLWGGLPMQAETMRAAGMKVTRGWFRMSYDYWIKGYADDSWACSIE
jgi:hypothetical protein